MTRERASRLEAFGAIVQMARPRALVFVDRARARHLGVAPRAGDAAWADATADGALGRAPLSAPLEAHLQLTNHCGAGCVGCYTGANPAAGEGELGLDGWKAALDHLAARGVFHVALGGGESFLLPWLFEIADRCRARNMVPNVTTSGLGLTEEQAKRCRVFGRVNVSLDGTGPEGYGEFRRADSFAKADRALKLLRKHNAHVGINTVVTRSNFDHLEEIVRYARDLGCDEVEFLRLKPAGRASDAWAAHKPTPEQNRALLERLLAIRRRHRISLKVDCSFAPMVAWSGADPDVLEFFSVLGCEGGDYLVGIDAAGNSKPCSFEHDASQFVPASELKARWRDAATYPHYRGYSSAPPEPCATCEYQRVCRGGCRVVAKHMTGDPRAPDPECPRVMEWAARDASRRNPARALPVVS